MNARAPFTDYWALTGPNVAISCDVVYDVEQECYVATSSAGFRGTGGTDTEAALMCFTAWMTGRRGWYEADAVPDRNEEATASVGCTCEWDDDGNPVGGHKPWCRIGSSEPLSASVVV